jgi:hypothetical protein
MTLERAVAAIGERAPTSQIPGPHGPRLSACGLDGLGAYRTRGCGDHPAGSSVMSCYTAGRLQLMSHTTVTLPPYQLGAEGVACEVRGRKSEIAIAGMMDLNPWSADSEEKLGLLLQLS